MTKNKPAEWAMKAARGVYMTACQYEYGEIDFIEAFAAEIEAADKAATERERERCAEIAEATVCEWPIVNGPRVQRYAIAAAIRNVGDNSQ